MVFAVCCVADDFCCTVWVCRNWVLATNTWCAAQRTSGPVVSVVGKGHLPGIVYAVEQLVDWMAKTGGRPFRLAPAAVSEDEEAAVVSE